MTRCLSARGMITGGRSSREPTYEAPLARGSPRLNYDSCEKRQSWREPALIHMAPAVLAFGLTILLTPVVIVALRRGGVVDVPNERSSHVSPTPRGGGLAAAAGTAAALAVAGGIDGRTLAALLAALCSFAVLGLAEDLVGVPVMWRLAVQVAAAAVITGWLVGDLDRAWVVRALLLAAGSLFVVGYVNAFNFMDGINGISAVQTATVGAAWYLIAEAQGVEGFGTGSAIVAAAALAFAPYNFPRARVFLGDVGSYAFGAVLAALAVLGLRRGLPAEAVLAPLSLYLADTGTTLAKRVVRGEPWFLPHRDHVYQQLVILGWSHTATTSMVGALTAILGILGAASTLDNMGLRVLADVGIAAVLVAYLAAPTLVRRARPTPAPA